MTENKTNFGKENHHRFPRHHLEFVDHFHIVDIGDILNQFENISSEQFAQKTWNFGSFPALTGLAASLSGLKAVEKAAKRVAGTS